MNTVLYDIFKCVSATESKHFHLIFVFFLVYTLHKWTDRQTRTHKNRLSYAHEHSRIYENVITYIRTDSGYMYSRWFRINTK